MLDVTRVRDVSITVRRTTSAAGVGIYVITHGIPQEAKEPEPAERPLLSLESCENVFDLHTYMFVLGQENDAVPGLPPSVLAELCPRFCTWHDEGSLFPRRLSLSIDFNGGDKEEVAVGLEAWNRFWKRPATMLLAGAPRFHGGDVYALATALSQRLRPDDFRLRADSLGYRAGADGKDLGADIDFVGPGAAHERWKITPAYQEWLRESGQSTEVTAIPAEQNNNAAQVRVFAGAPTSHVDSAGLSPDGRHVLSTGREAGEAVCVVWNAATGRQERLLRGHADVIHSVAIAPDSRRALTASNDGTVRLWDIETGAELQRFESPGHVPSVAWSADGNRALLGTYEGIVILWDVTNWTELRRFDHGTGLWSVDFCPSRPLCLTAGGELQGGVYVGVIRLWDLDTGTELRRFQGPPYGVWQAVLSPDGRQALSAEGSDIVRLWDVESGQEIRPFRGHVGEAYGVAFTVDGRRALSAGADRTVRLWDVNSGNELHCFRGHANAVRNVVASRDGQFALSGGFDGTARLWRLPPAEPIPTGKEEE
jgi:WD40 repeat protein